MLVKKSTAEAVVKNIAHYRQNGRAKKTKTVERSTIGIYRCSQIISQKRVRFVFAQFRCSRRMIFYLIPGCTRFWFQTDRLYPFLVIVHKKLIHRSFSTTVVPLFSCSLLTTGRPATPWITTWTSLYRWPKTRPSPWAWESSSAQHWTQTRIQWRWSRLSSKAALSPSQATTPCSKNAADFLAYRIIRST